MDALDVLIRTIGGQAFKYVVNSGISLTSGYAVHQCSRLIKTVDDKEIHAELKSLQKILDNKVKVSQEVQGELAKILARQLTAWNRSSHLPLT